MYCKNCGLEYQFGESKCSNCGQVRTLQGDERKAYNRVKKEKIKKRMEEIREKYEKELIFKEEENKKLRDELSLLKEECRHETERKKDLKAKQRQKAICGICGAVNENGIYCSTCGAKLHAEGGVL